MTRRETIGQLFVFGFAGREPSARLLAFIRACGPGGVILFSRNLGPPEAIAELTTALQAAAPTPLFIAIDQEGGRVARLGPPFTEWPGASQVGTLGSRRLASAMGSAIARELRAVGITMNLAPVLDVLTEPANPVLVGRSFGSDPLRVANLGVAFFRGLEAQGVLAVGKHFPGHGDTTVDSHRALPVVPHGLDRLKAVELVPFAKAIAAGIPGLMTAHLLCPALDPHRPATLSPAILTGLLREQLGFSGLIMSDDLLMRGIADGCPPGEAAVRFLEAGGDLILICDDEAVQGEALDDVTRAIAAGRLSEERVAASLTRIARAKRSLPSLQASVSPDTIRKVVGCDAHRRLADRLRASP